MVERYAYAALTIHFSSQDSAGSELGSPTFTPEPSPTTKVAIQGNEKDDGSGECYREIGMNSL